MSTQTDLGQWLAAETLPTITTMLPSGRAVEVPRFLRHERRLPDAIPRTPSCWAPNKPTIDFEGAPTWAEFVIVRLLERQGWEARWLKNWTGGREMCVDVGRAEPLPPDVDDLLRRIDARASIPSGGGAWDVLAWRGGGFLCIESKQHRSGDKLRPTQLAWLDAAISEGVTRFAVVEYEVGRLEGRATIDPQSRRADAVEPETAAAPSPELLALFDAADQAAPSERIGSRDPIAAHGTSAIGPALVWISRRRHAAFAVKVIERIGLAHPEAARRALERAAKLDPTVAALATDAVRALSADLRPRHKRAATGRSGVLDASYIVTVPPHQGCEWLTRQGVPCKNPATRQVEGRYSCSRDHRP